MMFIARFFMWFSWFKQYLNRKLPEPICGGVITLLSDTQGVCASDIVITGLENNVSNDIGGVTRTITTAISFIATVKNKNGLNSTEDDTSDVITTVPDLTNVNNLSNGSSVDSVGNITDTISSSTPFSRTIMAALTLDPPSTFMSSTIMENTSEPISVSDVTMTTTSTVTIATNPSTTSELVKPDYNVTDYLSSTTELSTLESTSTSVTSLMTSSSISSSLTSTDLTTTLDPTSTSVTSLMTSSSTSSSLTSTDLTTTTILPTTITESTIVLQTTPKLTTTVPSSSVSSTWESTSGVNSTLPTTTPDPGTPLGIILGVTFGVLGVLAIILVLLMLRKYIAGRIRRKKYTKDEENIDDYQVDYKETAESNNKISTILRPHKKPSANQHPPVNFSPSAADTHPETKNMKKYFEQGLTNPTYAGPDCDNLDFLRQDRNRPISDSYDDGGAGIIPLSNLNSLKAESRFSMGPVILDDDEPSTQKTYDTMYSTHNTFKT